MSDTPTSSPAVATAKPKARFGTTFWMLNTIEMWERLAFYNLRLMAPIYIMQADNPGGLHLSAMEKGTIYAWWAAFQSLLPIITGGLADRFGYKKTLGFAFTLMMTGYLMIAFMRDLTWVDNYWAFFISIMVLATGTAFFKPGIQGSLANTLTKENSSVGWGLFYWVVNVGAFIGHYLPGFILTLAPMLPWIFRADANSQEAWRNLFLASAAFTGINFLMLFTFKDVPSGASKTESLKSVLWRTVTNIFEPRLLSWILIMSCFWLMMYQLWDLQPNFIADWVDSRAAAESLRWLPDWLFRALTEETTRGVMIPQQVILSANSLCIIIGVVAVTWATKKIRTLTTMLFGMVLCTIGLVIAGASTSAFVLVGGVVFFSLGEMATGPKKSEYLALIAPPGKKGLYLGYVNIPIGIGVFCGSKIAGYVYGNYGEKATLALKYLATKTPLGEGKAWDGTTGTLETVLGVTRSGAMAKLQEVTGLDATGATHLLWNTYQPNIWVWVPFAMVGVLATIALFIFGRMARRWSDMDA